MATAADFIKANDHEAISKFVLGLMPSGNASDAIEFLERVIGSLRTQSSNKKARISVDTPLAHDMKSVSTIPFLLRDAVDQTKVTLALQFPSESHLVAYLIGTKGQNVISIGRKTGTRVQIENEGVRGPDEHRHVFIMGTLTGAIKAYKLIHEHLQSIGSQPILDAMCHTRMIIPNDIVSQVIGKGGRCIKELSMVSRATKIELQSNAEFLQQNNGYYGRFVVIQGDFMNRLHGVYLLLRSMLQGMSLPPWFLGDALPLLHIDDHHNNNQGQIQYNPHSQFEANDMGPGIGIGNQFFPPMMNEQLPSNQYYPYHDIGQMVPLMNYGGQIGIIGDVSAGEGIPPNILHPELMVGPGRHGSILDPGQISDKNMKLDLQIPSDLGCVSFLMGSKGVKLREIEAASACVVTVPRLPQKGSEEEKDVKAEKSVTISGKNMTDITYAVELINLRVREWMRINAERISMNVKSNVTAEINGKIRKMVSSDLAAVRGDPYGGYSGILHNQNINVLSSNNNNNNDNMMHSQYQQQLLLSQQQQYQQQSLNQGYNNQQYPLSLQPVLGQNQYPTNNQQQRQHNSGY